MGNSKEERQNQRYYFEPNSNAESVYQKLYLHGFDTNFFKEKWKRFVHKDLSIADDTSIRDSIREVMTFYNSITHQSYYNVPTWTYIYNKGQKFYRVRRIDSNDISIPPEEMKKWEDVWNPPVQNIKDYGRLNYPEESFLYTTADYPIFAIKELKLEENEPFALITYEAKEDINVTIVGYYKNNNNLTDEENKKIKVLTDFFTDIFTKEISNDNKHLYKITSNLIKECYTIEDGSQYGWVYPSIVNKKGHNVCFKPQAINKLSVKGVELCRVDQRYGFLVNYVLDDINENSNFTYHLIGSEIQKQKYPHINKLC